MQQDGSLPPLSEQVDIDELLRLARDTSREARESLVAILGDLFAEREPVLSERERALMVDILRKLLRDLEIRVRRSLADRLAAAAGAPRELIRLLANDSYEVAAPVLLRSPVLRDVELIEVVQHRTRQHQLAVAQRSQLSERVSDALVDTGDEDVIAMLLGNPNARISEATAAYLTEQAKHVDKLQEPLVAREELSPELARRLYWHVSAALRQRLLARHDLPESELDTALETVVRELASEIDTGTRGLARRNAAAWALADRIAESGRIDRGFLLKVLRCGEFPLFEALFGRFSGIKPPRLQHVLYDLDGRMLAAVACALGFPKTEFVPLYLLTRKDSSDGSGAQNLAPVLDFFDSIPPNSAAALLRRWQRDPEFLDAVDFIEEPHGRRPAHRAEQ